MSLDCGHLHELAPELALGTLPGRERAHALAHLEHCGECRLTVEELADAADALLLLAPEADPPAGFSRRVTNGLTQPHQRRWRKLVAAGAAAALVLALGVGIDTSLHRGGRTTPVRFALNAKGVHMARFMAASGERVRGQVFSYQGSPSWVFMTVHERGSSETYVCELELTDGSSVRIGSFQLHDGVASWGRTLGEDTNRIKTVRLLKAGAERTASASFL
jgi:hypothetical protein